MNQTELKFLKESVDAIFKAAIDRVRAVMFEVGYKGEMLVHPFKHRDLDVSIPAWLSPAVVKELTALSSTIPNLKKKIEKERIARTAEMAAFNAGCDVLVQEIMLEKHKLLVAKVLNQGEVADSTDGFLKTLDAKIEKLLKRRPSIAIEND